MEKISLEEKFTEFKLRVKNIIEKNSYFKEYLNIAHEKTKIDVEYIFIGGVLVLSLLLLFILGLNFLIDVVGFVFPFIASIKAIETPSLEDDKQWLTYWIVFIFFKLLEGVADLFISSIPFYFLLKFAFLLWCWHPKFLGAQLIYNSLVKIYVIPLLGLKETIHVPQKEQKVPNLELTIERIKLYDVFNEKEIFVEICVKPPTSRKASGIEETNFKTESYTSTTMDMPRKVLLSPLPDTDGIIHLRIMEKVTFGDDNLLDTRNIEVKSLNDTSTMKIVMEIGEVDITGHYNSV